MKWNNCIGEYTTQNGTRYLHSTREGKTTTKGMFIFKNNFVTSSDLNEIQKKWIIVICLSAITLIRRLQKKLSHYKILEKTGFYKGRLDGIVGKVHLKCYKFMVK